MHSDQEQIVLCWVSLSCFSWLVTDKASTATKQQGLVFVPVTTPPPLPHTPPSRLDSYSGFPRSISRSQTTLARIPLCAICKQIAQHHTEVLTPVLTLCVAHRVQHNIREGDCAQNTDHFPHLVNEPHNIAHLSIRCKLYLDGGTLALVLRIGYSMVIAAVSHTELVLH